MQKSADFVKKNCKHKLININLLDQFTEKAVFDFNQKVKAQQLNNN